MKNRFGFIPIVLPAIVMVLIIGLINLTGPQTAQAQGNVDEPDARLTTLTVTGGGTMSLSPAFKASVANYTYKVDNTVTTVTFAGAGAENYAVTYQLSENRPTSWSISGGAVTLGTGDNPSPGSAKVTVTVTGNADTTAAGKTATYVITLTKMAAGVHANGPRLTSLAVTAESALTLTRRYSAATGFNAAVNYYTASVDYNVQSVTVTAEPDSGETSVNPVITPASRPLKASDGTTTADAGNHRVRLSVGQNKIEVSTSRTGSKAKYTVVVTRQAPELTGITLSPNQGEDLTLTRAGSETTGFDGDTRDYTVAVGFQVDSTTVSAAAAGERREVKDITPSDMDGSTKDNSETSEIEGHDVKFKSGQTTTIVIRVDHWLATEDANDGTAGSTSTGEYRVKVKRSHPMLRSVEGENTGLALKYGANDTPAENLGTLAADLADPNGGGLRPKYAPGTMKYAATIPYQYGFVTIDPTVQTASPPGDTLEAVLTGRNSTDSKPGIDGFQVDLEPGVTKTVTVRARSKTNPTSAKTDYTIALTRAATPLDNLALCHGTVAAANCSEIDRTGGTVDGEPLRASDIGATEIGLMPPDTTTPHEFNPATTTYTAVVDYAVSSTRVVASNSAPLRDRVIGFTKPIVTSSDDILASLAVGNNAIAVQSGVTGNASTYEVAVKRNAPEPALHFVLLDGDGERLGDGSQQLDLGPQTRNYNFDENDVTDASFDDDDLLLLRSLKVYTDTLDPGVRVSYDQITVNQNEATALPIPSLPDGDFTLEFEVRYKTGVGNEEDFTTHRIAFIRPDNSQPTFPSNHPLRGQQIVLLHDEKFRPDGTNRVIELPFATGGDGDLMYELIGDETVHGSKDLPSNLGYNKPTNSPNRNGQVTGVPMILTSSDAAEHHLILRVWDEDAITGAKDEDQIKFVIRIVRDDSAVTPGPITTPDLAELFSIEVKYDDPVSPAVDTNNAKFDPKTFDPDRMLYTATVPTDVDQVDIHITASSSATIRMNKTAAPEKSNDITTDYGTGTRHEWNGHRLARGRVITVPNRYTIEVSDGGEDNTYTLDVVRDPNTSPVFTDSVDNPLQYYEGIPVGGSSALKEVTLPRPLLANGGNSPTSSWEYSLDRRLPTAPKNVDNFLGLEFDSSSSKRTLSGTPILDTNRTRPDKRLSDHSEVYAEYSVNDYDLDRSASDMDSLDVDIFVYRNVTLRSLIVDGNRVDLSANKEVLTYRNSRLYSYNTDGGNYIEDYTQSLAHDATMAEIEAVPYLGDPGISVEYSVPDAAPNTSGHQVSVGKGDNLVTVTVTNGVISARHVINLSVPGLEAKSITVKEDEDARPGGAEFLNKVVTLSPAFDRRNRGAYEATVETWVRSVRVSAVPVDPRAQVQVNDFSLPDADGYRVVNLTEPGGTRNITVGIHLSDSDPVVYQIDVTRKADMAPAFPDGEIESRVCMVNKAIKYPIQLPKATGGNGPLTYSVIDEDLPPGLGFVESSRQLVGTPRLDEGYSSTYMVTYTVTDDDGNNASSDKAVKTFAITITNDPSAPCAQPDLTDTPVDPADRNTLSDLIVTYDKGSSRNNRVSLDPAFSPRNGGPYTANVPPDATNVQVETVPAVTEAQITINNTRISGGEKLNLPPVATIVVSHSALADTMTYTLNTVRETNTAPKFSEEIGPMTLEANMAIEDPIQLPKATGGNPVGGELRYALMSRNGEMPEGLTFNASSREISGTPRLLKSATETEYEMTYTATDAQNESASLKFTLTVCDASDMGCKPTKPDPNPGATPIDLAVTRSGDSATLTWRPGDDATKQAVVAMDFSSNQALLASLSTLTEIAADADEHTFTGLTEGVSYTYVVVGFDASGNYKDATGAVYKDSATVDDGN